MSTNVVGLDLSLVATGVACEDHEVTIELAGHRGASRLHLIRQQVMEHVTEADLVVLEGYSYGSQSSSLFEIGELGGVIRLLLWSLDKPTAIVAPATLKRYATGKGNANKREVERQARRWTGREFDDDNQSDAWWLRMMGLAAAGDARGTALEVQLPERNQGALKAVQWPEIAINA